jgi:hypothetical protein
MEAVHGLPKDAPLDLMLHSPGGHAEAAEAIIAYLRGRFPGLRVIVPVAAMSAATMMAMAADEIVMAAHSQLGPIDPQLTIQTTEGPRSAPAAAIKLQFAEAQKDLAEHPQHTAAWLPILRSMTPALLQICDNAEKLSTTMVNQWLEKYMFAGRDDAAEKAATVTAYLSDYKQFMSHGRRVDRDSLRQLGVKVIDLEADQDLQDRVLSVYHAVSHTMALGGAVKIIENNLGKAMIRSFRQISIQAIGPTQGLPGSPGQIGSPQPSSTEQPKLIRQQQPNLSRQQQRGAGRKNQNRGR